MPPEPLDDWSHPEIVRNIKSLTRAVNDLVRNLDTKYVSREVYELRSKQTEARLNEMGVAHADLAADVERHHRDHEQTAEKALELARAAAKEVNTAWTSYVAPMVSGALVAVITYLLTR